MRLRVSLNRVGAMGWVGPKLYCRNSSDHTRSVFAGICSTYPEIAEATNAEGGSVRSERVAFLARPRDWLDDEIGRASCRKASHPAMPQSHQFRYNTNDHRSEHV